MAINFAEVFLRESGAEQDRAQSMAEMQLRAKQFEQNLAVAEANVEINKLAQALERDKFNQKTLDDASKAAELARQFDANLQNRKDEFKAELTLKKSELNLSEKQFEEQIRQFNKAQDAELNRLKVDAAIKYKSLEQDQQQFLETMGQNEEFFYADMNFKLPERDANIEAQRSITKGREIQNSVNEIQLGIAKRGDEFAQEQTSDKIKILLGFKPEDNLTNEKSEFIAIRQLKEKGLELTQKQQELAQAQQTYFERPNLSFEEAAESVKQGPFSRFKTVSPFERNVLNPIKNVLGRAVLGEIPSMEGRMMRGLESEYGVRSKSLLEALQQKSTEGSIVPGMNPDLRNIYQGQAALNVLNPDPFNLNINTSTIAGPNYPFYGADYSNYIQMMMPQEEVIPEQ